MGVRAGAGFYELTPRPSISELEKLVKLCDVHEDPDVYSPILKPKASSNSPMNKISINYSEKSLAVKLN